MAYRLVENKGDSVAVPQLVIAKLPELEDDWLRVALFVVATGETDPARIAAALRLKSPERAQTALVYWKGSGLLESCGEPQARGGIDSAPAPRAHLTTPEVASAAQGDPAIAGLVQECQALMGGVITQADTNILVSMYLSDGMPVDMILLGVAHFAALGKRSARYIERALLGWQREIPAKPPSAICVCWTNARPTKKKPQSCWALPTPSSPKPTAVPSRTGTKATVTVRT